CSIKYHGPSRSLIPTTAISSEYRFGHFGLGFTNLIAGSGSPKREIRNRPCPWSASSRESTHLAAAALTRLGHLLPGQDARRIALPAAILVVGIQAQATFRFCDD